MLYLIYGPEGIIFLSNSNKFDKDNYTLIEITGNSDTDKFYEIISIENPKDIENFDCFFYIEYQGH